jgi:hypothetical protein
LKRLQVSGYRHQVDLDKRGNLRFFVCLLGDVSRTNESGAQKT